MHQLGLQVVQYKHIAVQVLLRLPDDLLKFLLTAFQRSYTLTMHSLAVLELNLTIILRVIRWGGPKMGFLEY